MAYSLSLSLLYLGLLCGNGLVSARGSELFVPDPNRGPHFTGCRSRELETFRCWWSAGTFQNLTEPGALRVFYQINNVPPSEWQECPDYTRTVENECYFNKTFTHIWTSYCVFLRSVPENITYDEYCFTVENIVHPDPPIGLNWTLLNVSRSELHFDILVRWTPPPSADVQMGWMHLVYQVQYRVRNTSQWERQMDLESGTQQSIYGLLTDKEYEVRVRCKMSSFANFGEFSNSIIVHVAQIPSKESTFPTPLVLIFGVIGVGILLVLLIFSQQQRLMVIFLPPIPAPKIKGIDPELLKNGKLDQLNSLLSSQDMFKPDFYHEDPWVEFIQLDLDDPAEKNDGSDTQHLLGLSRSASSRILNFKSDDDSGRASCYNPEIPDPEDMASLLPGHSGRGEQHPLVSRSSSSIPDLGVQQTSEVVETPVQTQPAVPSWVTMDFYAQVSDFTPAGGVVLSPGQLNGSPEKKKEEENEKKKIQFQLLSDGAYTSENTARQLSADVPPSPGPEQGYQSFPTLAVEGNLWNGEYLVSASDSQTPHLLPEAPPVPILPPVSDYTVVQEVDAQHSLLLNPPSSQPAVCSHSPNKHLPAMPTMPMGYLTPELLGNLTP